MKRERNVLGNEKGAVKFIFTVALIIFLGYAGVKFGMPFYRHEAFKTDAAELARVTVGNVGNTRMQLYERAQELKLPLGQEDIIVQREGERVSVRASWSETVDILGLYERTFDFDVNVKE